MARLSRPISLVLIITIVSFSIIYVFQQHKYSLNDLSNFIESMDISSIGGSSQSRPNLNHQSAKITDNNDPEILQKHKIETQVNELLKKKIDQELKYEREKMQKENSELKEQNNNMKQEKSRYEQEKANLDKKLKDLEQGKKVIVTIRERHSTNPEFTKKTYSFKTNPDLSPDISIDGDKNEVVILSSINQKFDQDGSPFQKFLELIQSLEYPHHKTSLSFLLSDKDEFSKFDKFVADIFSKIEKVEDPNLLKDSFSKITLLNAEFIESQFKVERGQRHRPDVQKKRRKLLAQLRNFLVFNGIDSEDYSLSLDSDIIGLPKGLLTTFIESKKDIATIRIDLKNAEGKVTHEDYDLNSWSGDRRVPNPDEDKSLDTDPNFFFEPRSGLNAVHLKDFAENPAKFNLDKNDPKATIEIDSVGGAVLFVKTEVFKQGVMFPPFYVIGTKWNRNEGYDGIETEGLCYQAKTIGYKCWAFPNLSGYHVLG